MGVSIQLPLATFSKSKLTSALTLPNRMGLVSEFVLGGSQASSIKNLADPAAPLTVTGSPKYFDHSCELRYGDADGFHHFSESKNVPATDMTLISIKKKSTAGASSACTVSNYTGMLDYSGIDFYNSQSGTGTITADLPLPAHSDFFFCAATGPYFGYAKLFLYTEGALSAAVAEGTGTARPALPFVIGASYGGGVGEHAFFAVYNRILSDAEIQESYLALKAYYAKRGVVVS